MRFFGRCGECVIDVVDQFIERAIAVAQVVGDHLAISADDEEMGDRLYGIEVRDAGGAVSHDVDLPIGRGSFDRGECLVRISPQIRRVCPCQPAAVHFPEWGVRACRKDIHEAQNVKITTLPRSLLKVTSSPVTRLWTLKSGAMVPMAGPEGVSVAPKTAGQKRIQRREI